MHLTQRVETVFKELLLCSRQLIWVFIKKLFFAHFNAGPLAKGIANHSLEIRAPKSSNISLSCWIDYDDICPGELLWKFNDKPDFLPECSKKYNVELKDTDTKCQKEFRLSIFDVTESDEGKYICLWLCEYENTTRAAIDLKVVDDPQIGRNFVHSCSIIIIAAISSQLGLLISV